MNLYPVRAIYMAEMARTRRTLLQSIVSPVISTSLYFIVFGAAIGSRITEIGGVSYGALISESCHTSQNARATPPVHKQTPSSRNG